MNSDPALYITHTGISTAAVSLYVPQLMFSLATGLPFNIPVTGYGLYSTAHKMILQCSDTALYSFLVIQSVNYIAFCAAKGLIAALTIGVHFEVSKATQY